MTAAVPVRAAYRPRATTTFFDRAARARAGLFTVAFFAYTAIGNGVVIGRHVLDPYSDAVARLAHAYMVFYGGPGKLTAIGFVWPPLMTLVMLPFAVIAPLATGLTGMVLMSALFGAYLLVALERVLEVFDVPFVLRVVLAALFGLNPLIVYYASNGMSEVVYLAVLVAGVDGFLRWARHFDSKQLARSGIILALGVITRYEVIFWVAVIAALVFLLPEAWWHGREAVEGSLVAFLAPTVYTVAVWSLFNWMILGNPLYWIRAESSQTFTVSSQRMGLLHGVRAMTELTWQICAPLLVVTIALVVVAVWRRSLMSAGIAAMAAMNAMLTLFLLGRTGSSHVLQLRYNMRGMPFAVIGAGWLWYVLRDKPVLKWLAGAGTAVLLVAAIPIAAVTMDRYPLQFTEQAFIRALVTGESQEGARSVGVPVPMGEGPERAAADWIKAHVRTNRAVLTDDAQAFHVMLLTGKPSLFLDRIKVGDVRWKQALEVPPPSVQYLLVSPARPGDLAVTRFPPAATTGEPGWRLAYRNDRYVLWDISSARAGVRDVPAPG